MLNNQKVIVITGCSTGLGLETAVLMASKGHKVYGTMRNTSKSDLLIETAKKAEVEVIVKQLDVTNTDSVNNCMAEIMTVEGRIDVLVNNAGAGFIRTTEQATEAEIKWQLDLNFMGVVRTTKAVLPYMREVKKGHIINISSVGGLVGQPFNEIYCASKFAVEGYTESLASYVQPAFNINFSTIEPGGIISEFANNALTQFTESGGMVDDPYKPILECYIASAQKRSGSGIYQTSKEVAEVVATCIESSNPPIRMRTSKWAEEFSGLKTVADPDGKKLQAQVGQLLK